MKEPMTAKDSSVCSAPNPYTRNNKYLAKQEQEALQEQIDRERVRDFAINRICNLVETS